MHSSEAVVEAGRTRLRPIMMTTIAMVFGMLPIALATGTASEWKNGLGLGADRRPHQFHAPHRVPGAGGVPHR